MDRVKPSKTVYIRKSRHLGISITFGHTANPDTISWSAPFDQLDADLAIHGDLQKLCRYHILAFRLQNDQWLEQKYMGTSNWYSVSSYLSRIEKYIKKTIFFKYKTGAIATEKFKLLYKVIPAPQKSNIFIYLTSEWYNPSQPIPGQKKYGSLSYTCFNHYIAIQIRRYGTEKVIEKEGHNFRRKSARMIQHMFKIGAYYQVLEMIELIEVFMSLKINLIAAEVLKE
ncbi:hypothetical protein ACSBL2_22290 [Pedobacter sp. AW31-3R]|uniref:hypothetical protein n=1 Tax=Pedobacter sp. AW31-3R TaxID=3445781 RepID=UPI003FA026FE